MKEVEMSELLIKGLMSDMPENEQKQVNELLVDINNTMAEYPETVRVVAMAFIGIKLAKM